MAARLLPSAVPGPVRPYPVNRYTSHTRAEHRQSRRHRLLLEGVAIGIEDYYAIGEEPGRWTAHTHELLGIDGLLEPAQLTAVLAGRDP